jgi:hypothetical protein
MNKTFSTWNVFQCVPLDCQVRRNIGEKPEYSTQASRRNIHRIFFVEKFFGFSKRHLYHLNKLPFSLQTSTC